MGSEGCSETVGTSGTPDILGRIRAEIVDVQRQIDGLWPSLSGTPEEVVALGERFQVLIEERAALRLAESRLGGGFDTDYYHRARERGTTQIVRDGAHPVVEDRR
jgi:hypothetical protein